MVPFESLDTVSYSHSVATMTVSSAVSTQYTNMTDTHDTQTEAIERRHRPRLRTASRGKKYYARARMNLTAAAVHVKMAGLQ